MHHKAWHRLTKYMLHLGIILYLCVSTRSETGVDSMGIRQKLQGYVQSGMFKDVIKLLFKIERELGSLVIDHYLPSLYLYKGELIIINKY